MRAGPQAGRADRGPDKLKGLSGSLAKENLIKPCQRMDRHALRAIVKGAVHDDSALVSAVQLMAASRRGHQLGCLQLRIRRDGGPHYCRAAETGNSPPVTPPEVLAVRHSA